MEIATQLVEQAYGIPADAWGGHEFESRLLALRDRFAADHELIELARRDMDAALRVLTQAAIDHARAAFSSLVATDRAA